MSARLPRAVLARHFSRTLVARSALCGAILLALMEILSLLEQTDTILERHQGALGILIYAVLHMPKLASTALPLAVMIGALFTLTQMTLGSEIASLRAAGLSTHALYRLMLPGLAILSLAGLGLQDVLAPRGELALAHWWSVTAPDGPAAGPAGRTPDGAGAACDDGRDFWFHDDGRIVHVGGYGAAGARLCDVTVYTRRPDGLLAGLRMANVLRRDAAGRWNAGSSHDSGPDPGHDPGHDSGRTLILSPDRTHVDRSDDGAGITLSATPNDILRLAQPYPSLSTVRIIASLRQTVPTALPHGSYAMMLLSRLLLPITVGAMLLLALPVVYIPPRTGTGSPIPIYCLGGGFLFVVGQGLFQALGEAGTLPVILAAIAAPALAVMAGITIVLRMEER